jgi:hypothetical protein
MVAVINARVRKKSLKVKLLKIAMKGKDKRKNAI